MSILGTEERNVEFVPDTSTAEIPAAAGTETAFNKEDNYVF